MNRSDAIARVMKRWGLVPDGSAFRTHASTIVPVRRDGVSAMLKLAHSLEEARGGRLMAWWNGNAAAPVLARHGSALLMLRATGGSLAEMEDEEATRVIIGVAGRFQVGAGPLPRLIPLRRWFRALEPVAMQAGGVLAHSHAVARKLLDEARDEGVLHGDLHHGNVLNFGSPGWLAIDPKGLWGEQGFEYANLFRNPDVPRALRPGRMARQAALVAKLTGLAEERLLGWVAAVAGLSAAWTLNDGGTAESDLAIARLALQLRGQ